MKTNLYIFLLLCFVCLSCTERMDIDTDDMEDRVSIFGELDASKNHQYISVYKTAPYFSKQDNVPIDDAQVTITSEDNKTWNLSYVENGMYQTDNELIPLAGKKYTLKVLCDYNNDGISDVYKSTVIMPAAVQLDSIHYVPDKMIYDTYNATIYCENPGNERYCVYKFYDNDELITPQLSDWLVADIQFWNKNEYIDGLFCYFFFDKKDYDKFSDDEQDDYLFVTSGDVVTIEMSLIDKGYYDFISQCQTELHGENPMFGGPAANITTNIDNGAYGYWGAVNYVKSSDVIPLKK